MEDVRDGVNVDRAVDLWKTVLALTFKYQVRLEFVDIDHKYYTIFMFGVFFLGDL